MISGSASLAVVLLPLFRIAALGCWLSSPVGKLACARVVGVKKTDAVLKNSNVAAPLLDETHSHNSSERYDVFV